MKFTRPALILALAVSAFAADPAAVTQAKKQIAEKNYDAAISGLEAAAKTNPKSPEIKATLADALLAKADSIMYNDSLPPRSKYPEALRTYRKVLTIDKDNKKAQSNIATIEGIYKSMGRPVPE